MSEFKKPEEIIEGVDLNYDLLHFFGYLTYLVNRDEVFPSEHICACHQRFMDLYGNQKPQEKKNLDKIIEVAKKITDNDSIGEYVNGVFLSSKQALYVYKEFLKLKLDSTPRWLH